MPDRSAAGAAAPVSLAGGRETALVARDLLAAVGEVMLTWGYLESAIIGALGRPARGQIVTRWLEAAGPAWPMADVVREAAAVRNYLAHGLCAIEAQPATGEEARVMCRDPDGGVVSLPISRLRQVVSRLDALRLQIEQAAAGAS